MRVCEKLVTFTGSKKKKAFQFSTRWIVYSSASGVAGVSLPQPPRAYTDARTHTAVMRKDTIHEEERAMFPVDPRILVRRAWRVLDLRILETPLSPSFSWCRRETPRIGSSDTARARAWEPLRVSTEKRHRN